jgi:Zn-dependent peptidase ImmA (M78 family)/transcriptional regulator with XRE-family HTH domain
MKNVKIKQYRDHRGLSQEQLGIRVGVTRQTIASWENGDTMPDLSQLLNVAVSLQVPVSVLLGEDQYDQAPAGLLFRADDPTTLTSAVRALLSQKAADYSSLEHLLGEAPGLPESRPLDAYDDYTVYDTAVTVRDWLGMGNASPLRDLFTLLENRGLKIILHELPTELSGFSGYTEESGGIIVINATHPTERQYLTAVHELGHLIFHRREYANAQAVKAKRGDPREMAANRLAGAVMLPDAVVRAELHPYKDRWIPEPLLLDIKQRYWVSMQMILLRAGQAGILTEKQAGIQFGALKKKYPTEEPGKLPPAPKRLGRLERLTYRALIDEEITTSRAAEILGIPLAEVRDELRNWMDRESPQNDLAV